MPLTPNARCPICGAAVFFWKDSRGSTVWFDSLGAPWPKHPWLDLARTSSAASRATLQAARAAAQGPLAPPRQVSAPVPASDGCCLTLFLAPVAFLFVFGFASAISGSGAVGALLGVLAFGLVVALHFRRDPARAWAQMTTEADLARRMAVEDQQ